MPPEWYTVRECIAKDGDTEEEKKRKEFNRRIAAYRKPYFMTYVYPKLRSDYKVYLKNNEKGAVRRFCGYGIRSLDDLIRYEPKTDEMKEFLRFYEDQKPVGENECVVNRISRIFEKQFNGALRKTEKTLRADGFDYSILKSGVVYSKKNYDKILLLYRDYCDKVARFEKRKKTEKIDNYDSFINMKLLSDWFRSECYKICCNEDEMCDIVLDICYGREKTKQFAWDMCGEIIVKNLLRRNGGIAFYPKLTDEDGEFIYGGNRFVMQEIKIAEEEIC